MYEITIHTGRSVAGTALKKVQDVIKSLGIDKRRISSFEGEMSYYIYIETSEKQEAEKIIKEVTKIEEIESAYLKPKGSPPE